MPTAPLETPPSAPPPLALKPGGANGGPHPPPRPGETPFDVLAAVGGSWTVLTLYGPTEGAPPDQVVEWADVAWYQELDPPGALQIFPVGRPRTLGF